MAATDGDFCKSDIWDQETPSKDIVLVSSPPPSEDELVSTASSVSFSRDPRGSADDNPQDTTTLDVLCAQVSSRYSSPLSTPPHPPPPSPANQGGGGGAVRSGASTPNAGMGGGGPTGGGGGPRQVNA
ncbi:MAG: hypothetical protein ACYC3I_20975, partial [Gemmataceae bacterium]